jgi:hypothetical protein
MGNLVLQTKTWRKKHEEENRAERRSLQFAPLTRNGEWFFIENELGAWSSIGCGRFWARF